MKKKSVLFCLFVGMFVVNLSSQVQCKEYSTSNGSLTVRLSKSNSKVSRDKYSYYKYEITIVSRVYDEVSVVSFGLCNADRKKSKYILEDSPVDKTIECMGRLTFDFLSTDGNIKASDFNVVATICR